MISARGVVQANAGAHSSVSRSLIGVGQAVTQVGAQLEEVQRQRQAVDDFKAQSESNRLIEEALSNTKLEMAREGNRSKLPAIWDRQKRSVEKQMKLDGVSSEKRIEIQEAWKHSQQKAQILLKTEDVRRALEEARVSTESEVQMHLDNGDLVFAQERIRAAGAANVYGVKETKDRLDAVEVQYDQTQARRLTEADPFAALDKLKERTPGGKPKNFKKLSEPERQSMITHARVERNRWRSEFYGDIILETAKEDMTMAERESMWEYIQVQEGKGRLSSTQALSLRNTVLPKNNLGNWNLVTPLSKDVQAVDISGGKYSDAVVSLRRRIATENLPPSERAGMYQLLQERFEPESVVDRYEYTSVSDYIDRRLANFDYGFEIDSEENKKVSEKAHEKAHRIKRQVRQMFKDDPNILMEDVIKRVDTLSRSETDSRLGMRLLGP